MTDALDRYIFPLGTIQRAPAAISLLNNIYNKYEVNCPTREEQQEYVDHIKTFLSLSTAVARGYLFLPIPHIPALGMLGVVQLPVNPIYFRGVSSPFGIHTTNPIGQDVLDISVLWQQKLTTKPERRKSEVIKNRPIGEEGFAFKCLPDRTYLLQDCEWVATNPPTLIGNKSLLLIKTDDKIQAE